MKHHKTKQEVLAIVAEFVTRMKAVNAMPMDPGTSGKATRELLDEILQFDRSFGPGLSVGRCVSWLGPGGCQPTYFVVSIYRSYVHLVWLPTRDEVESPVVVDGRAMRLAIERAIEGRDLYWRMCDYYEARQRGGGKS